MLARVVSYVRDSGQSAVMRARGSFFSTHLLLGEALLRKLLLGQFWVPQTRPCVLMSVHRRRVVFDGKGAFWLTWKRRA